MGFFDDVGDALEFEWFHAKELWNDIKEDPERVFIGAFDPISSDMWGAITGKDYEPMINQWGGATNKRFVKYAEEGGNPEPAMFMHDTAKSIAKSYALAYGASAAGGYAGSQGASPEVQMGIEKGITAIGGVALDPPPPSEDDPDLAAQMERDEQKRFVPTFGPAGVPEPVNVPGVATVVNDPYAAALQPQPTFRSL